MKIKIKMKMIKKAIILFILVMSLTILSACGDDFKKSDNQENAAADTQSWVDAYAEFLRNPENYIEDGHFAGNFALADLDNNNIPELIIVFYNGVEGGVIFANIYLYDGNVGIIGRQINMYYKSCYLSTDLLYPGIFVEGGRSSNFSCSYWTVKDNEFSEELLWSTAFNPEIEDFEYKEFSGDRQLIDEAKNAVGLEKEVPFFDIFDINEGNMQKIFAGLFQ